MQPSEGNGFNEASLGGSSSTGFDFTQFLFYVALIGVVGFVGALLFSGVQRLRGRRNRPS